jgi:hypothetical protein
MHDGLWLQQASQVLGRCTGQGRIQIQQSFLADYGIHPY